jgi:hypothetical protein
MSVLTLIQQHCRIHALSIPTAVIGSTDTQVQQLYGILLETLDDMVQESKFNVTTQEAVFIAQAQEDQGAMATLAPNGYFQANFETFFDRTLRRPVYGPLRDDEWQAIKALPNPGPFYKFRIRQDRLLLNPIPAAPFSTIAFEYMSTWCVKSSAGVLKAAVTADDDGFVFPEPIIRKWLMYRWKLIKGLPYQEDRDAAYSQLNNYIAKDKVKRRIDLGKPRLPDIQPGIIVPTGSWGV